MYGYIYLTENLISGKCYIGRRKSSKFDYRYKGSGKILKHAIEVDGWDNFICQPIQWCETEEELNKAEIYWIQKCNAVSSPYFYNIARGGKGANDGMKGHHHSEETKKLISDKCKGKYLTPEQKKKQHDSMMGHYCSLETRTKISEKRKGKPFSEEHKKALSIASQKRWHPEV